MITVRYGDDCREGLDTVRDLTANGCVLALGFFDGVHMAHRGLLERARREADRLSLPLAVFTFSGKSGIKKSSPRIYPDSDRLELLADCGVDISFVADFDRLKEVSPERFVEDWLIGIFSTRVAACGYNFRFGKDAGGDAEYLRRALEKRGVQCIVLEKMTVSGERVSTTRIRELLSVADVRSAARLLGTPYFISGKVERGDGRGHTLGIPTVNTPIEEGALPVPHGVYASLTVIDGAAYRSLTNIGKCPTFTARAAHAETTILGFSGDLYGKALRVYLVEYLREERVFESPEALIKQIKLDTDRAQELDLEEIWQEIGQS